MAGSHARRRRLPVSALLGVAALALVLVVVGTFVWRARTASEAGDCTSGTPTQLVASADIAPALQAATAEMTSEGRCTALEVVAEDSAHVVDRVAADPAAVPDLWVPDSPVWRQRLTDAGVATTALRKSVASTPVVLVGGPATSSPDTWYAALASGQVRMQDPLRETAAAMALAAPRAERDTSGVSLDEVRARVVPVAQQYGESSPTAAEVLYGITPTSKDLVAITEQRYLAEVERDPDLAAVPPRSGAVFQHYPLVVPDGADASVREAAAELLDFLDRPQGTAVLAEHGFRAPDGAPLDRGVGTVSALALPKASELAADLRVWEVLTVPSSMLTVLDVSGSMDFETGDGTRMELAAEAARTALAVFGDNSRIGLWAFSIDQGGEGVDHRELAALQRLDAFADGGTQRDAVLAGIEEAAGLTTGGTGLYDTTLAAYREAVEQYDADYFNSVVLFTDGANDDPGSISLEELVAELEEAADPERPVRIIAVGISEDADLDALRQIAEATDGMAFGARDPRDILEVTAQAILTR